MRMNMKENYTYTWTCTQTHNTANLEKKKNSWRRHYRNITTHHPNLDTNITYITSPPPPHPTPNFPPSFPPPPTFNTSGHKRVVQEVWPWQALAWILVQQSLQEILEHRAHILGPLDWVLDDHGHQLEDTVGVERWGADEQFVQNTAHCPVISNNHHYLHHVKKTFKALSENVSHYSLNEVSANCLPFPQSPSRTLGLLHLRDFCVPLQSYFQWKTTLKQPKFWWERENNLFFCCFVLVVVNDDANNIAFCLFVCLLSMILMIILVFVCLLCYVVDDVHFCLFVW